MKLVAWMIRPCVVLVVVTVATTMAESRAHAEWATYQADAAHTGHVPGRYQFGRSRLQWQTPVGPDALNGIAVGGDTVFVTKRGYFSSDPTFHALDQATGSILWDKTFNTFSTSPPSYSDGIVYLQTDGHTYVTGNFLRAYDAKSGAGIFDAPYDAQWETYLSPTPFGGHIFVGGGYYGGMYSFNGSSNTRNWFGFVPQYDGWTPAVDGTYAYAYTGSGSTTPIRGVFTMLSLFTGATAATIVDTVYDWTGYTMNSAVVLGLNDDAFTINGGRLVSWDTTLDATHTPHIRWTRTGGFSGQPSLANGKLFVIANGELRVLDEMSGEMLWSWRPPSGSLAGPLIVTDNLVFATSATDTFAIKYSRRPPRQPLRWSHPVSGTLAFSDRTLYVAGSDGVVSAFRGRGRRPRSTTTSTITFPITTSTTTTTSTQISTSTSSTIPACSYVLKWGEPGDFSGPAGVAIDGSGSVYVTDFYNSRIQKFDGSGAFLTMWGTYGSGDGQFVNPYGVTIDTAGQVYVTDTGNHRVQKFDASGTFLGAWGAFGSGSGEFDTPAGIGVDAGGNVYVADFDNHRVQKFDPAGGFIDTWGTLGSGPGQFYYPGGLTTDGSGNVYVADTSNNRIQKFDGNGIFLTEWGGFSSPYGVATDGAGHAYVADYYNGRIVKFDTSGAFLGAWGTVGSGDGQLINPRGLATDASGNVYVADHGNDRIQKFACP